MDAGGRSRRAGRLIAPVCTPTRGRDLPTRAIPKPANERARHMHRGAGERGGERERGRRKGARRITNCCKGGRGLIFRALAGLSRCDERPDDGGLGSLLGINQSLSLIDGAPSGRSAGAGAGLGKRGL